MKKKEEEQSAKLIRCGMGLVLGAWPRWRFALSFCWWRRRPFPADWQGRS